MSVQERHPLAAAVGICLAAAEGALLAVVSTGRLAPVAVPADVAWFGVWFAHTLAGAIVLERVPRSPVGWLLCIIGTIPFLAVLLELGADAAGPATSAPYLLIPPLLLLALPATFPDGMGRSRLRRVALAGALVLAGLALVTVVLPPDAVGPLSAAVVGGSAVGGLVLLAEHLRLARRAPQPRRTQHVIFLAGFAAVVVVMLLGQVVGALVGAPAAGSSWIQVLGLVCLPAAIAVAMLGAGLWGTDLARGRRAAQVGLVLLPVGVCAILLIAVVVALLPRPGAAAAVAAGGALLLAAGMSWAWRAAGRRLYGPGGPTADVPISADGETDHVALVAAALRSPSALLSTTPEDAPPGALVVPLGRGRHLVVHPRRPGESFTRRDGEVAARMGAALAVQLERADLSRSLDAAHAALATQRREEQRRLRGTLHDTVGPLLVGAEMQARALRDAHGTAETVEIHDSLRQAREAMRDVLDEGSPRALAAGLVPALTVLAARWRHPPVTITNDLDPDDADRLGARTCAAAYLIVAEALANVTQHAAAASCQVRLAVERGRLLVSVTDDGVGIDPTRTPGLGLASLRGRALELGGELMVLAAGSGTTVTAYLPLQEVHA